MAKSLMGEALPRSNLADQDIQMMFDVFQDHKALVRIAD